MKQSEIKAGRTYQGPGWGKESIFHRKVISVEGSTVRWNYVWDDENEAYRNPLSTFASWAKSEVKGEGV